MTSLLYLLAVLCLVGLSTRSMARVPFEDGDRWTMVGDSITHGGEYHTWVYLYCLTRFPELELSVANAGNSGDDAHGALERYDWDIQPKGATVASVMFGMNDVRREIYGDVPDTPQVRDQRIYILEGYRSFMNQLVQRLREDGARLILMTPTIYDETAQHQTEVLTGVNGALGACAAYVTQLAASTGATLIDFYGPMNEINARMQAVDPAASLIKRDRVHPNSVGQFVMAYLFLKAVDAPGLVSRVHVDVEQTQFIASDNASVGDLVAKDATVSFTVLEQAIPFPVGKAQQAALEWVPFQNELNRQTLRVSGLQPGEYVLTIDGQRVRDFQAEALSAGVNLALEVNTPQAKQAAEVLKLMQLWHTKALEYRSIPTFEFWNLGHMLQPVSEEAACEYVAAEIEQLKEFTEGPQLWRRKSLTRYLERKPREALIAAEMENLISQARAAAQPQSHHYQLKRIE
ncbi:SGNH/GDSL hydrolase family protein [Coraliomargarita algicola]|uniref:SGNH/GDSL hydrolase family protein n=1 Tax=Coraliomargarita algicola TaxID=3092156 RepID=A0ABZ0RHP8_9BACT|nr:SGNH/GDSL hydrolase family protein [Coraliomargarita sp. J2-16]WPJ95582.1 SGNH/GDSL hydrolase family protein [Coraliomargarita sp. J2-16]